MFDPVAVARAHTNAIAALERAGDMVSARVLRVQGPEVLRLASERIGRIQHAPTDDLHPHGVDPKADTDLIPKGFTDVR
ncbi:MAG: hypothetical protein KGN77_05205 [Xanthomonadaceae bacterium]|nr:hypothetical protein [Xanthomonadaceae bacterium]